MIYNLNKFAIICVNKIAGVSISIDLMPLSKSPSVLYKIYNFVQIKLRQDSSLTGRQLISLKSISNLSSEPSPLQFTMNWDHLLISLSQWNEENTNKAKVNSISTLTSNVISSLSLKVEERLDNMISNKLEDFSHYSLSPIWITRSFKLVWMNKL